MTGNAQVGTVADVEGNIYKTIRIGEQIWMAENLRVRRTNDNLIFIADITSNVGWEDAFFPGRCRYNNSDDNVEAYGYLYNGYAVADGRLCPIGWELPSVAQWTTLIDNLGGHSIAGGKMKETGVNYWSTSSTSTNESGWSSRGAGRRFESGTFGGLKDRGQWWSSTAPTINSFEIFDMVHSGAQISQPLERDNNYGLSVRCIKED